MLSKRTPGVRVQRPKSKRFCTNAEAAVTRRLLSSLMPAFGPVPDGDGVDTPVARDEPEWEALLTAVRSAVPEVQPVVQRERRRMAALLQREVAAK